MTRVRDFSEKTVLITGAGGGIGAQTAIEFSKSGAQVVITDINAKELSEVSKECTKVSPKGLKALEVVADVNSEEDCKRLIETTIKSFGKLDVLVNNAGISAISYISDTNIMQTYDQIMSTNVRSVVYLTHLSVEHLERSKGNVINISSIGGLKPCLNFNIYCMSKSAIDMLTKCLALELGPKGIRVNAVNPGLITRTNVFHVIGLDKKQEEAMLSAAAKSSPLGRVGERVDIANAILFLASDESSFVTGITFVSDGGNMYSGSSAIQTMKSLNNNIEIIN